MSNNAKKIAVGAIVAGAAGYVAGILTAPKSGKETRKDIKNAATKAKLEAEKTLKGLHSQLDNLLTQAKAGAGKVQKRFSKEYDKVINEAQVAKVKIKEILTALHEGDTNDTDLQASIKEAQSALNHLQKYLKKHPVN